MDADVIQYLAIVIELIGRGLIAVELYWPKSVVHIDGALSSVPGADDRRSIIFAICAAVGWIVISGVVSLMNPELSLIVHGILLIATVLGLTLYWLIQRLIALGIFLGRGSATGGVGLILALTGIALEMGQL